MKITLPADTWVLVGATGTEGKIAHYSGSATIAFCEQVDIPTGVPPLTNDISDYFYDEDLTNDRHPKKFYNLKDSSRNVWACSLEFASVVVQVKEE